MRTLVLAGLTMVSAFGPVAADAQRLGYPGAAYPVPGAYPAQPVTLPAPPVIYPQPGVPYPGQPRASRWGGATGGRWSGGTYAPGGWNAYRRPSRGWQVPVYWNAPDFYIDDFASYGLSAPPRGYGWHRYYDDAVLLDPAGRVYESRGGIDWDGGAYAYAQGGTGGSRASQSSDYAYGYADDRQAAPPPPRYVEQSPYASLPPVTQHGAVTSYQTGSYAGSYGGGYAAPGTTTTVVTIQPTETVTTTTTEYVEETRYVAPRRVYHAPRRHYRVVRRACSCGCCR